MLIKSADDKGKRLELLLQLQQSPRLSESQRRWAREEHARIQKGVSGEAQAAFYIDSHFKDSRSHMVMHDLRFSMDGEVAQIDHLVMNRGGEFYLIESKNFGGNLQINDQGEFTMDYGSRRFGIPSPLEQSRRHERILRKVVERLELAPRLGGAAVCRHLVLLHPKAIITRPPKQAFDSSMVIKADQIATWHAQFVEGTGVSDVFRLALNLRSTETLQEWAAKICRQHRPTSPLELPPFMAPRQEARSDVRHRADVDAQQTPSAPLAEMPPTGVRADATSDEQVARRRLICAHCSSKITFAEGRFCWNQEQRFGGLQYCRTHQAMF